MDVKKFGRTRTRTRSRLTRTRRDGHESGDHEKQDRGRASISCTHRSMTTRAWPTPRSCPTRNDQIVASESGVMDPTL